MKAGDKVHYIPFEGADPSTYQNGIIKSFCDDPQYIFVVFHCNNEWDHFWDYTAQRTNINQLKKGWIE